MVTFAGTQNDLESLVQALINLENDALEAYDETIERLENPHCIQKVKEFREDHYQHLAALEKIAAASNIEIGEGSMKSLMTKGKVMIADMVGDDEAILGAMKTNENDTVSAYENALEKDFLTRELQQLCEKGAQDERRHRAWMEQAAEGNFGAESFSDTERVPNRMGTRM